MKPHVARIVLFLSTPMLAAQKGEKASPPDFTAHPALPAAAKHDWTLGPTGARG